MTARRLIQGSIVLSIVAMVLFVVEPVVWAQEGQHPAVKPAGQEATTAPSCDMATMPMMAHMKKMAKLKAVLDEAKTTAEAEKAKTTVAKIDEALKLLEQDHQAMHQHMTQMMQKMKDKMSNEEMMKKCQMMCPMCKKMIGEAPKADKVVNSHCPMTGIKIDPNNVPAGQTREFQGQKVGFCCGNCPLDWDKLNDQQKQEKLHKVVDQ